MAAFAPLIATNLGVRVLPGLPWPLANDMSLSPLQSNWQIVFLHLPSGSGVISVRC